MILSSPMTMVYQNSFNCRIHMNGLLDASKITSLDANKPRCNRAGFIFCANRN